MALKNYIKRILPYILSIILVAAFASDAYNADAAPKKSKTSTSQSSSRKSKSKNKKSSNKKKKRKKNNKKKKNRHKTATSASRKSKKRRSNTSRWTSHREAPAETAATDSLTMMINNAVLTWVPDNLNPGGLRVNRVSIDKVARTMQVRLNENFTYLPITREFIDDLHTTVRKALPDSLAGYRPSLTVGSKPLTYYISKIDKLPAQYRKNEPFVREAKPDVIPSKGMLGDKIVMWHSHGRYYKNGGWYWQRPLLFGTMEDVYPMSYMLPFIVPMMENAGAYVFLPRERDTNPHEVIVDNDSNEGGEIYSQPYYKELNGSNRWENGEFEGFIYDLPDFRDTENPFEVGTYRQTRTVKSGTASKAAWYADIPEDGEYAVYVSYKSLPESTTDALYTVNFSGGSKDFLINQTMGGSTWIYLGTFPLTKGYSDVVPIVSLSNMSGTTAGKIVTADAVKIGGGMGNIARSPKRADIYYDPSTPETDQTTDSQEEGEEESSEEDEEEDDETLPDDDGHASVDQETPQPPAPPVKKGVAPVFRTSGLPRFVEGARYWLQWAGAPEDVYSPYHGRDDYKDDYTSRALWVNYLAGGSRVLPDEDGLRIPIDAVMALHTDAGKRANDSSVGTLGIYYTQNGGTYEDGTPRINSRMLTDYLMRQITADIRQTYDRNWTRRSMWDKSYVEARVPEVPTSLIELMSHQNFGDMQYGLDPGFRFVVSRAIYKAMVRFMAERKDREVVIQPLPVHDFAIMRRSKNLYRLSWQPTPDKLEPTAMPKEYVIQERREGEMGFHTIGKVSGTTFDVKVKDHAIHSFRIIAANEGGKSFPSEILAFRESPDGSRPVLIINGFTRVAAAKRINDGGRAGFDSEEEFGVPYIRDISFTGHQQEFRRSSGDALGKGNDAYVTRVIAGNTFDFPYIHGQAVAAAGRGFVSTSAGAVESGHVKLKDYDIVDLILGKQKESTVGAGQIGIQFKTIPEKLQKELRAYVHKGGDLLVSGQYVASDLTSDRASDSDRNFAAQVLGVTAGEHTVPRTSRITLVTDDNRSRRSFTYCNTLNDKMYIVDNPDMLIPIGEAFMFMDFDDNGQGAAVARKDGKSHTVTMSVPFESINNATDRIALMKAIFSFFQK